MKRLILILVGLMTIVRFASASNNFSYTATAAPGSMPDGVDESNNPVNVWTVIASAGGTNGLGDNGEDGSGVYFGNPDGSGGIGGSSESSWQAYSYQNDGTGLGGSIDCTNIFAGGPLAAGQTVSINFVMRATDPATDGRPPGTVGVSLLNGTNTAVEFFIYGGGPGNYFYTDAHTNSADAGPYTYQYQNAFNIAFTVTGPNTYSAIAGQDAWSGTFNGPLTGIDVFNHAGGNGSDVGFNNLTVAPSLLIENISPNDNNMLFNATNTFSFNASSGSSAISASGVQVLLNGSNISTNLVIAGAGTQNISVTYTNLQLNQNYTAQITVTNQGGAVVTKSVTFDTFSSAYYTWESEDFDFNGGEFIDDPLISTNIGPESYYDTVGITNVDEYVPNYSATQPHLWRTNDEVSIALAGDTPRAQFVAAGLPGVTSGYLVGYFNPGNWVNYTRTFPAGTYNIYGRLANGNGGLANCALDEVTGGQGTTSQTLTHLGIFQFTGIGWNNFGLVPLTDAYGNLVAVQLNGKTTMRVTSGPLGGGVNVNFFMLAPGSNTPPAIAIIYPDGSRPFETTNSAVFSVSSSISTVSQASIEATLNGANVTSQLAFSGSSTNWRVSLPLPNQGLYTLSITATDAANHSNTRTETFDTFTQSNLMIEADEYDFNGGQFIDDAIETATNYLATNSYYFYPEGNSGNAAVYGEDYTTESSTNPAAVFLYRFDAFAVGTQITSDFLRNKFVNSGQDTYLGETNEETNIDFNIGWWDPGTWLNYTRTFPTNNYYVFARLAGGVPYSSNELSLVMSGLGTPSQTTQLLGTFSDPNADGFQSWHWVPLQNNGTNVIVSLGGVQTLKATSGPAPAGGNVNAHFYMFVPAVTVASQFSLSTSVSGSTISIKFPTQEGVNYTVLYSASLNPASWNTLMSVAGNGAVETVTDTISGSQKFYKVQAGD